MKTVQIYPIRLLMACCIPLIIAPLAALSSASAQNIGEGDLPIYISSDVFEGTEKIITWTGNVRIVQGKAILVADKVVGLLDDNGDITQITATQNVKYSDGEQAISGDKGVYKEKERTLTMTENVIVTQGRNVFTAGSAVYWLDSGKVRFNPVPGERVRGIFYRDSKIDLDG